MEKSSQPEADVNTQRISALRTVTEQLGHISVGDTGTARQNVARQVDLVGGAPSREASEQQQPGAFAKHTHGDDWQRNA